MRADQLNDLPSMKIDPDNIPDDSDILNDFTKKKSLHSVVVIYEVCDQKGSGLSQLTNHNRKIIQFHVFYIFQIYPSSSIYFPCAAKVFSALLLHQKRFM